MKHLQSGWWMTLVAALGALTFSAQADLQVALEPRFASVPFQIPLGLEQPPDGSDRFFVVEQQGRILILNSATTGTNVLEFFNIVSREPHTSYEEGLLGLAFHPGFATNGLFYVNYTQSKPRHSVVSEFRVSATDSNRADLSTERILLNIPQPYPNHKGGQVSFGPDGYLYAGFGDGGAGNDPHNNGQNTAAFLGKILRIDPTPPIVRTNAGGRPAPAYRIPSDNPFVGEPELWEYGVRREIWAYGLRNPWRFSWDRETGEMWAGDVGQDKWEEVDLIVKGGNYGWCPREGAHHFKPGPEGARYIDPVMEYPHDARMLKDSLYLDRTVGMSVTGGYVYRGRKFPALRGVYVYGDFVTGTIWGFRYEHGQVTWQGKLLSQPKNITSFGQDREGELYALTYDGHVYAVTVP